MSSCFSFFFLNFETIWKKNLTRLKIKFDVNPAKKIEEHPQWDFTDEEEDKNGEEVDEEFATESESE